MAASRQFTPSFLGNGGDDNRNYNASRGPAGGVIVSPCLVRSTFDSRHAAVNEGPSRLGPQADSCGTAKSIIIP